MGMEAKVSDEVKHETLAIEGETWRQELRHRIVRMVSLAALPMLISGFYDLTAGRPSWLAVVKFLLYGVILACGFVSKLPYQGRVFGILIGVGGMSLLELYEYGWAGDARSYLILMIFASIFFLEPRAGYFTLGIATLILLGAALGYAEGWLIPLQSPSQSISLLPLLLGVLTFLMIAGVLLFAANALLPRLLSALKQSVDLSRALEGEREKLDARTQALQVANTAFQRRAMYLESSAHISQVLTTLFEVEPLLDQAVGLISRSFNFYHTGIFLMDEAGEWAILRAASSEGGRKMLARGHRLRVGGDSMVGWVTEHRKPRIASDVGRDAVHFVNPDLPATRSEITLPLLVAGHLIGVLDVQSTEEDAFDRDDIRTLQGLASQLAIAINNARRLSDEAALLEAASPFYRIVSRIASTRNLREIYTAILEATLDFSPAYALILRNSTEAPSAVMVVADVQNKQVHYPERLSEPIFHEIYFMGALLDSPLLVDDITSPLEDVTLLQPEMLEQLASYGGFRSIGLIPIRAEVELHGLLFVGYVSQHHFSPTEKQLYRIVSSMGGVALERLELMRSAQAQLARDRWLRGFTERLIQIPDLRTATVEAVQILHDSVSAEGITISLRPLDEISAQMESSAPSPNTLTEEFGDVK